MSHQPEQSFFEKLKLGAMMGGTMGLTIGLVMGTVTVLLYNPGPNGYMRTIGKSMLNSGAFFAGIMSIGSVLRSEPKFKYFDKNLLVKVGAADSKFRDSKYL